MEKYLKKCPFCGSKAVLRKRQPDHIMRGKIFVCCEECKAKTGYYDTEEEAIKIWNKRANDIININYCPHCGEKIV